MPKTTNRSRNQNGVYLIELLSALVISGILAVVLGDNIARTIQLNTRTEKNLIAPQIAQNLLERLRALPPSNWNSWPASGSRYNINVDPTDGTTIQAPTTQARAAMLDGKSLKFLTGDSGVLLPGYKFSGTAIVQYQTSINNMGRSVTITVNWSDSTAGNRIYVLNGYCSYAEI